MKFQMAFAASFFLWDFPFDVLCFLWHPCSCKMSFWDVVFCSYIHTLLLRCHAFWLLRDFRLRLLALLSIRDFMGLPYVGNFLMRFPVFACIIFLFDVSLWEEFMLFATWFSDEKVMLLSRYAISLWFDMLSSPNEICVGEFMLFAA